MGTLEITTDHIRTYANLPSEVPEALLSEHLGHAKRRVVRMFGRDAVPTGLEDDWRELIVVGALISVLPWLHMITLDGVSKAGRLDGEVDFRFMDAEELDELLERLRDQAEMLEADISNELSALEGNTPANVGLGPIGMIAV